MDAGPDALHPFEPLGAGAGDPGLGPVSPELALVDPELARRVRELLPEPRERPRAPRPLPRAPAFELERQPEVRRPRRWPRTIALAIVIFVAGAASGTLLGNHQTGSPATTLEVRAVGPAPTVTTAKRPALRPPTVSKKKKQTKTVVSAPAKQRRRHARVAWASNVLGVEATVSGHGVALRWQAPAGSARVIVLRTRGTRSNGVVVYRGRAARFRDASPRRCTAYRYTIVNDDRHGHRSTGVPTSVVTRCS